MEYVNKTDNSLHVVKFDQMNMLPITVGYLYDS